MPNAIKEETQLIQCEDIKRNKVLRWLDVGHASRSQSEACKKQQTGTGTWFLDSLDYVTWRTKHSSLIWLHGKG